MLAKHGIHGPNLPFHEYPAVLGGPPAPDAAWYRLGVSQAQWVKLLAPAHRRADAQAARDRGLRVLVRVPGEGIVYDSDVFRAIAEFGGVADVLEIGNEPYPTPAYPTWEALLWNHAFYLQDVWQRCAPMAHTAGLTLCAPGWRLPLLPPVPGAVLPGDGAGLAPYIVPPGLASHLQAVYAQFDALAGHAYDPWQLATPAQYARLDLWHAWMPGQPLYVTEYGLAGTTMLPGQDRAANDLEKARRLAAFIAGLPAYVPAAFLFLLGGTPEFALFNGSNSYHLSDAAWRALGAAVAAGGT